MSKKIVFKAECKFIGKEFCKATNEFVKDGKRFPAKAESWSLYFLIGSKDFKTGLYDTIPEVIEAKTTRDCFVAAIVSNDCVCDISQNYGRYSILQATGFVILPRENEVATHDDVPDEDDIDIEILKSTKKNKSESTKV